MVLLYIYMWTGDHRTEDQAGTGHEAIQQSTGRTVKLGWFFYIPGGGQEIIEHRTRLALGMRPFNSLQVDTEKRTRLALGSGHDC